MDARAILMFGGMAMVHGARSLYPAIVDSVRVLREPALILFGACGEGLHTWDLVQKGVESSQGKITQPTICRLRFWDLHPCFRLYHRLSAILSNLRLGWVDHDGVNPNLSLG